MARTSSSKFKNATFLIIAIISLFIAIWWLLGVWRPNLDSCLIREMQTNSIINSISFSIDGKTIAAGEQSGVISLWRTSDGQIIQTMQGHTGPVNEIAFSPDGKLIASASSDRTLRLWQIDSDVSFGVKLQSATSDQLYILDSQGVHMANMVVGSLAFSPNGQLVAAGGQDGRIWLWQVASKKIVWNTQGHIMDGYPRDVLTIAFSPDGSILASGGRDGTIHLWDIVDGKLLKRLSLSTTRATIQSIAFSPDGTMIASGAEDGFVRLWAVSAGRLVKTLEKQAIQIKSIAFSRNGQTLAAGGGQISEDSLFSNQSNDARIRLWKLSNGQQQEKLVGHTDIVRSLIFSPDGQFLASGGSDYTLRLWHAP